MANQEQNLLSKLTVLLSKKRKDNVKNFDKMRYQEIIQEVKRAQSLKPKQRDSKDRRRLKRYAVFSIGGEEKLVRPSTTGEIKYYVSVEEAYAVLLEAHLLTGHGGKHRMVAELKKKYANITQQVALLFVSQCLDCVVKGKAQKKGIVLKPIIHTQMNSRCQVDLIDMQSKPDGEFRHILVYQDHLTKFVVLRALERKSAGEVVNEVLDIFCLLGAPLILQSDNGREFANGLVEGLRRRWPQLKIVHGAPRHSQSQGSVERANQDVEKMLTTHLRTVGTTEWAAELKFVQHQKNNALHSGIKMSPYKAMFCMDMRVGLLSSFPNDVVEGLETEEELLEMLQHAGSPIRHQSPASPGSSPASSPVPSPSSPPVPSPSSPPEPTATPSRPLRPSARVSNAPRLPTKITSPTATPSRPLRPSALVSKITSPFTGFGSPEIKESSQVAKSAVARGVKFAKTIFGMAGSSAATCTACGESCGVNDQCSKCRVSLHADCAEGGLCPLCHKGDRIATERKEAHGNIRAQAKKMVLASKNRFSPAEVGGSVAVPIPDVDRSRAGERNVVTRIMEEDDGFYTLANKDGTLDTKLIRSQFQVCKGNFIAAEEVSSALKSLRALSAAGAHMGGQGFERCHCAAGCKTNRCSCKKAGKICNSKCHSGTSCKNK